MATEVVPRSIYDIPVKVLLNDRGTSIQKKNVKLSEYREKVLLIVNVDLDGCYVPEHFQLLNMLYEKYRHLGFEILAFPCNQPASDKEIWEVARKKFKVEFPIFSKIDVNGKNASPLYKFLKSKKWGTLGPAIKSDFTNYFVDRAGKVVDRSLPTLHPDGLETDIQILLTTPFERIEHESVPFITTSQGEKILLTVKAVRQAGYPSNTFPLPSKNMGTEKSIYNFTVKDIHENDVMLSKYRGKVLVIVNLASQGCGTRLEYKRLNILYEKYRTLGFEILAFPCNYDPRSSKEFWEIACEKFKAEFPIFSKITTGGKNASPLYKFLKSKKWGIFGPVIKNYFTKYLIDREGEVENIYFPSHNNELERDIRKLLTQPLQTKELKPVALASSPVTINYKMDLVYNKVNLSFTTKTDGPKTISLVQF